MKKKLIIALIAVSIIITGCTNKKSINFKKEYEALNNTEYNGTKRRNVKISENNVFEHIEQEKIIEKIKNKETFYLYVGDTKCPWCRSSIEMADKISREKGIKKIYYINIWDDDFNEIFRDKYQIDENGDIKQITKPTKTYKYLLKQFDKVLSEYTLTSSDGEKKEVGEKRIFAPNYFYVEKGKIERFTDATSDKQENAYSSLTKEILKDQEIKLKKFFK